MSRDAGGCGPTEAEAGPEERRALFRIVRGTPSDEEVAALTVVLAAMSGAAAAAGASSGRRAR